MNNTRKNGIKTLLKKIFRNFNTKKVSKNDDIFIVHNILVLHTPYIEDVISFLQKKKYIFFTKSTSSSVDVIVYNIPSSKDFLNNIMSKYNQITGTMYVFGFQKEIYKKNYIASFECSYVNNNFSFKQNDTIFVDNNSIEDFVKEIIKRCNFSFQFMSQYRHISKIVNNYIEKNNILPLLNTSININKSEEQRQKAREILYHL